MGSSLLRGAIGFAIPGGLMFAGMVFVAERQNLAQWLAPLQGGYPYIVFTLALLLGWRFDRSRLVFAAVLIGLAAWLLVDLGGSADTSGRLVVDVVGVLLPLNIAFVAVGRERGIFTWHGLVRWSAILVQCLAVWGLFHFHRPEWLCILDAKLLVAPYLAALKIEQPALLAFALALLLTGWRASRQRNAMDSGFFWALALLLYGLSSGPPGPLIPVLFASAILILIVALVEASHVMAYRDDLTGLPGRRALNQALLKLGSRYTVAMLDVDHFKRFNDRYGHDVGDQALKMVAARMASVTGRGKAYRYGGEEFTVLFPGKPVDEALDHLERLRKAISQKRFTVRGRGRPRNDRRGSRGARATKGSSKSVTVTVSIGAAERDAEHRDPQDVIKAADQALYRAKKAGRNRVVR